MTEIDYDPQVTIAKTIAIIAHAGQTDKAGDPYINHPERVAGRMTGPTHVATAWLHDVLEDTAVTESDLLLSGVEPRIIRAVRMLTRRPDVSPEDYYAGVRANSIARAVKLGDIEDNTDPSRLARLDDETIVRLTKKYAKAKVALGVSL